MARLHPNQLDSMELLVIIITVAIAHQTRITGDIKAKIRATDSRAFSSNNNKTAMLLVSLQHRCAHHPYVHQFASLNLSVPLNAHPCVNQFAHLNSVALHAHPNSVVPAVLLFKCLCQLKLVQALSAIITLAALALPR